MMMRILLLIVLLWTSREADAWCLHQRTPTRKHLLVQPKQTTTLTTSCLRSNTALPAAGDSNKEDRSSSSSSSFVQQDNDIRKTYDDGWKDDKAEYLAQLEQLKSSKNKNIQTQKRSFSEQEPKRDLFIPIFTLLAIAGFTGAYAYETFKLYSNGELYLPGMH